MENKIKSYFRLLLPAYILLHFSAVSFSQSLKTGQSFKGIASFYAHSFTGKKTANGELFDNAGYTCAHKYLPFGTILEVKNQKNGRKVKVRVNDRGPYTEGRLIDLSYKAAKSLGFVSKGVSDVTVKIIDHNEVLGPYEEEINSGLKNKPFSENDSSNLAINFLMREDSPKRRYFLRY